MSLRPPQSLIRAAALATLCVALAGCVSLFPKAKPAQLYRFGAPDVAAAAGAAPVQPSGVAIWEGPTEFDPAASNDRIMTMTGMDAAYISDARWVSPASVLFDQALQRTFEQTPGAPRLVPRFGLLRAPLLMNLDVQNFEARYDQGAGAAPLVMVKVQALLIRTEDRSVAGEKTFVTTVRASDNRVGAIVEAYNDAVGKTLTDLVAWTSTVSPAK